MASLIALSATENRLPLEIGSAILEDAQPEAITWVAPFDGHQTELEQTLGAFPKPNETHEIAAGRILWSGPDQALILGTPVTPENAAFSDQSDGWTVVTLTGETAKDILARLTPLDLRDSAFAQDATARTLLGHMTISLTRRGAYAYEIMAFRSMTRTLIHDLERAMTQVAARSKQFD
ncbi:sarcosine oxidase subunit gamma [bacterium]|nr:sarcosine oxidase subunit gamma [bacterium]